MPNEYTCEHMGCNLKFKTKRQKLIHHNKMEPECRTEHSNLIKIIKLYKLLVQMLKNEGNSEMIENNELYKRIKAEYEVLSKEVLDEDYFHCLLGDHFESEVKLEDEDNI